MKFTLQVRSLALSLITAVVAISATMPGRYARAEIIIYTSSTLDIVVSSQINVGNTPLKAVTLTAIGHNGYKPKTFDSTKSDFSGDGTGITTSGNFLHQVGIKKGEHPAPLNINLYTPTNDSQLTPELDTHFLIDPDTYSSMYSPSENMNVVNTADDYFGHYGNSLVGTFSLNGLPASSTWNLAYIVVPDNTVVHLDFEIIAALNGSQFAAGVDYFLTVPEPGAVVLLITGGIALLVYVWRRRKP